MVQQMRKQDHHRAHNPKLYSSLDQDTVIHWVCRTMSPSRHMTGSSKVQMVPKHKLIQGHGTPGHRKRHNPRIVRKSKGFLKVGLGL